MCTRAHTHTHTHTHTQTDRALRACPRTLGGTVKPQQREIAGIAGFLGLRRKSRPAGREMNSPTLREQQMREPRQYRWKGDQF